MRTFRTAFAEREAAKRVPVTMGKISDCSTQSDNVCSVVCEKPLFSLGEYGLDTGRNRQVLPSLYPGVGIMSTSRSVERVCQNSVCGRSFVVLASQVRRGRGCYCSRSCKVRHHHARYPRVGAANPNFKGALRERPRAYVNRFRAKYPEKARAHDAVKIAIASGRLVRPLACQRCAAAKPLHAHHHDYTKPLNVVFVCRDCHRVLDSERREAIAS